MYHLILLSLVGAEPKQTALAAPTVPVVAMNMEIELDAPPAEKTGSSSGESANFVVRSQGLNLRADDVASNCETVRSKLHEWLIGANDAGEWKPKCEVVLHADRVGYLKAVGRGGTQTAGSSTTRIEAGRVIKRRIDLLVEDCTKSLSALPHEMVHILLADRFPKTAPPRWAEEGLALLNDAEEKQSRHHIDLRNALQTRTTIPLRTLFATADYPSDWQRAVFYGESMSVVEYLTQLDKPEQFLRFVDLSMDVGHEHALSEVYNIDSSHDFERLWRQYALKSCSCGRKSD